MPNSTGLVLSNSANATEGKHIHNYSTFSKSLSYRNYNTIRFAEYTPTFVMEGVERDNITLNSTDKIDSLSLSAPFKGSIKKVKESFKVPISAILPRNWDIIYTQPSNGDDVPTSIPYSANCNIADPLPVFGRQFIYALNEASSLRAMGTIITRIFPILVMGEYFYSNGNLLSSLGYHTGYRFSYKGMSYDKFFDSITTDLFKYVTKITVTIVEDYGKTPTNLSFYGLSTEIDPTDPFKSTTGTFRQFIDLLRENPSLQFTVTLDGNIPSTAIDVEESAAFFNKYQFNSDTVKVISISGSADNDSRRQETINLSRLLAYQIVCAHFYTNSTIDLVYSAELYRQYMESITHKFGYANSQYYFTLNGFSRPYDALSGRMIQMSTLYDSDGQEIIGAFNTIMENPAWKIRAIYLSQLFGYRKSLRYGDYFVGCRPRPLAPVNTDVAVNNSSVSVIDITKSIQAQRFANSVMRSRSKIEEYVKSLFGKAPAPDYHNPFFLSREEEIIYGEEVQNTSDAQTSKPISRTGLFGNNIGRYTFTFDNEDMHPCIYLQLVHFDCKRAYTRTVDRQYFINDRYDMFNPDFQYIGDQPVFGAELGVTTEYNSYELVDIFGYQGRDMEYKQRFDVASGGFVENLPGWIMDDKGLHNMLNQKNINDLFIRSYNSELDKFFISLTGFSLGSYFHFICITDNNVDARRAMAVDPQILA